MKTILLTLLSFASLAQIAPLQTQAVLHTKQEIYNVARVPVVNGQTATFMYPANELIFLEGDKTKQYKVVLMIKESNALPYIKKGADFVDKIGGGIEDVTVLCCTDKNNWVHYTVDLSSYTSRTKIELEYSYGNAGSGYVELHYGSLAGPLIAAFDLVNTTGWKTFKTLTFTVASGATLPDKFELYLVFPKNVQGNGNIKTITFK